jgi:hypothetical protein
MPSIIIKRQTTFWEIATATALLRVHFLQKHEQYFAHLEFQAMDFVIEHPVLLDYQYAWSEIYVSSPSAAAGEVIDRLAGLVAARMSPWREAGVYFNNQADGAAILQAGYGLLCRAPDPVADDLCHALSEMDVAHSRLAGRPARWPMRAFIAGQNYVVAQDFRVEELSRPVI